MRSGISLIETVVATAMVLILASVFIPSLLASADRLQVQEAALILEELQDAISTMRYDNQDWPQRLSHVSTRITTSDQNICGNTYVQGRVTNWNGPYIDRLFPPTGLPIGIGTVRDVLGRQVIQGNPNSGGAISLVRMYVDSVPEEFALELNRIVDADDDAAAGTVRWSGISGSGFTTVEWLRIIKGC